MLNDCDIPRPVFRRGRLAPIAILLAVCFGARTIDAQAPPPFPRPAPPPPGTQAPPPPAPAITVQPNTPPAAPTPESLGVPLAPGAQFLTSYDAGRGQRYYLYGVSTTFLDAVTFYRTALKQRGDLLFETPGTHIFELARFRDETMAFPPSVTVKDHTWGGSPGYPNPLRGSTPPHFPVILQIVPVAAGAGGP